MDDGGDGGDVDEAVETLPVLASHGAHDDGRGGAGESQQNDPGEEADLDEPALAQVVEDAGPDEFPLGDEFRRGGLRGWRRWLW